MTNQVIPQLSSMLGLSCTQMADNGEEIAVSEPFLTKVLADFGFTERFELALAERRKQFWLRALPSVVLADSQSELNFDLHLPIEFVTEDLIWEICIAGQSIESGLFTPVEWELNGIYHLHDMEIQSYQISIVQPLSPGQYQLRILEQGSDEPLGETLLLCPPQRLHGKTNATSDIVTELSVIAEIDNVLQRVIEHKEIALPASAQSRDARLTALHELFIASTGDNTRCPVQIDTADPAQRVLAHYFVACGLQDEKGMVPYSVTKLQAWQTQHAQQINFYLWLILLAQDSSTEGITRTFQYALSASGEDFQSWLLADYRLVNCISASLPDNLSDNGLEIPINSHKLREQGYEELFILLSHLTHTADSLLLTDVLGMLQQWIGLSAEREEQGTWLSHPFQELLAIVMHYCELRNISCLVQDAATLPEELRTYLQENGLQLVQ